MLRSFLLAVMLQLGSIGYLNAANVVKSADPECRVDIAGEITEGDFSRIQQLKGHLLINDADGSFPSIVCLDSPGGSVFDGLQIAQFFLENGVSTRIRANKRCYSICAIMFMMGNVRAPEMDHINRRMHVTSKLGFHRPNITVREASSYTSGEVEASFDFALLTLLEIMNLAIQNEPWGSGQMIEPDLLRIMTSTPPNEMYLVEKIEEITRWNIGIDGLPLVKNPKRSHLHFACENMLTKEVGLPSDLNREGSLLSDAVFDFAPGRSFDLEYITGDWKWNEDREAFEVWSARNGLADVGCNIAVDEEFVRACGVDGATNYRLGDCDEKFGWEHHKQSVLYHPATTLRALFEISAHDLEAATARRCYVYLSGFSLLEEEDCLQRVEFARDGDFLILRHVIDWPGGSQTEIEISTRRIYDTSTVLINGKPGEFRTVDLDKTCVLDTVDQGLFCLSDRTPEY